MRPEDSTWAILPLPSDETTEEWRWVVGWQGLYQVSSLGNIYSVRAARTLRPPADARGRKHAFLSRDGVTQAFFVSHLVAAAFLGPRPVGHKVIRLDPDCADDRAANLRYGTKPLPPARPSLAVSLSCRQCGMSFLRNPAEVGRRQHNYCSWACFRGWNSDKHARFWERVQKTDSCWLWTGKVLSPERPYGYVTVGRVEYRAHRLSWELHFGPIPEGLFVCHHCDNPQCVRPEHLFIGTAKDNTADMLAKDRSGAWKRRRPRELRQCKHCGKDFAPSQHQVERGVGWFCSQTCSARYRVRGKQPVPQECEWCGKAMLVPQHTLRKGHGRFCSLACCLTHRNKTNHPKLKKN